MLKNDPRLPGFGLGAYSGFQRKKDLHYTNVKFHTLIKSSE